jgi:hypothetical protein
MELYFHSIPIYLRRVHMDKFNSTEGRYSHSVVRDLYNYKTLCKYSNIYAVAQLQQSIRDSVRTSIYSLSSVFFWHVYVLGPAYFVWPWKSSAPHRTIRDVTPGPLSATDTCIVYDVTHFEASWNVSLHTRYVSTCVGADCGRVGKQWTKAIRCGACYYSIVLNAHRVTSMADTDIDAVRKQKKADYAKQYRLKLKLLLQ